MKVYRILFFILLGLAAVSSLSLWLWYVLTPDRLNVLIVGSDQRAEEQARSDVLMVFSLPKKKSRKPTLLTIPRDTRVEVEDHGQQKITHAYALGEKTEGSHLGSIELTKKTVESFLNIRIDASVEVTFDSFKEIVDMVGGVDISKGHLNGEEALKIVRDRFRPGGDFARTEDQREVLLSLAQKYENKASATMLYNYFQTHPESRLTFGKAQTFSFGAAWLVGHRFHPDISQVVEEVVPGHGDTIYTPEYGKELYYWIPDMESTKKLIEENFL